MKVDRLIREPSEYCIKEEQSQVVIRLCSKRDSSLEDGSFRKILLVVRICFLIISIVSLLILFAIHISSNNLRRNSFSQLKIPFYFFLLISFLCLVITQLEDFTSYYSICISWALIIQFCSISSFCWLSAMSFDITRRFSKIRNPLSRLEQQNRRSNIRLFQLASLLVPALITLGTLSAQLSVDPKKAWFVHPNIGSTTSCFLGQYLPQFLYFHLPIIILLATNIILYLLLIHRLTCGVFKNEVLGNELIINVRIFMKFLLIMGLNWISEGVMFLVEWLAPPYRAHPALLVPLGFNQLSGFFLLLAFLSSSRNRELLGFHRDDESFLKTQVTPLQSTSSKEGLVKVTESDLKMLHPSGLCNLGSPQ